MPGIQNKQLKEPMTVTDVPTAPWHKAGMDLLLNWHLLTLRSSTVLAEAKGKADSLSHQYPSRAPDLVSMIPALLSLNLCSKPYR